MIAGQITGDFIYAVIHESFLTTFIFWHITVIG
jgi:hypothetical protein